MAEASTAVSTVTTLLRPTEQDLLDRFLERSSAEDSKFACLQCHERFNTLEQVKKHGNQHNKFQRDIRGERARMQHQGLPAICPVCLDQHTTLAMLVRHFGSKHTEERPFKCHKCDMAFKVGLCPPNLASPRTHPFSASRGM